MHYRLRSCVYPTAGRGAIAFDRPQLNFVKKLPGIVTYSGINMVPSTQARSKTAPSH
jgi:hypothetical protein